MSAVDELFAVLESIGATVTLNGEPVTKEQLKAHALSNVAARTCRGDTHVMNGRGDFCMCREVRSRR